MKDSEHSDIFVFLGNALVAEIRIAKSRRLKVEWIAKLPDAVKIVLARRDEIAC